MAVHTEEKPLRTQNVTGSLPTKKASQTSKAPFGEQSQFFMFTVLKDCFVGTQLENAFQGNTY